MSTPLTAPVAAQALLFADLGPRKVAVDFSGGTLSSDGGVLFLPSMGRGQADRRSECRRDGCEWRGEHRSA